MNLTLDLTYSLMVGLLVIVLVALVNLSTIIRVVVLWITWCRDIMYLRSLPCPPRQWILGHVSKFGPSLESLQYMQENHMNYPKLCPYWIGPCISFIITADLENVKMLSQLPGEAPRLPTYRFFHKWLGDGLVFSSGEKWKRHRRMLTPAFHFDILKQYIPVYNEMSHKLLEIWSELAETGESVEITGYLHLYTFDIMLRCMYSSDSNTLGEKDGSPYLQATKELTQFFINRTYNPLYFSDLIYYSTRSGHEFLRYSDVVHKHSEEVILSRRKELLEASQRTQPRKFLDFMDILLSAKDENGVGLTDSEIREEVDTFMFAGHDTTATGLGWVLYCLAMNKEHQELCRKEVREVLVGRDTDDITWEDVPKLSYITMCIKESMRLYPLVPTVGKLLSEEIVMSGQRFPKGTWMGIGVYVLHHDPLIWNDPEKFDPLRFTVENSKKMDPFAYLPFSAGPRNCIGQRFAMLEMKVTVAHIINKFMLEVDTTHLVEPYFYTIFKPKDGIKLNIKQVPM
ncbi:cytochrome P450 4X1-like isoform X1 [Dysidea avara]|uniref:cytochrome P450 4X1-like isoform X1 n=1 Tax=Dysidea avara TaxID=196820 RepID=UPI0033215D04